MKIKIFLALLIYIEIEFSAYSQKVYEFDFAIHGIVSKLDINRKSTMYNTNWEKVSLSFPSKLGYGFSLGVTRSLNSKWQVNISGRWQKWGGTVYASYPEPPYFLDLELTYTSVSVPLLLQYKAIEKGRFKWLINAGAGADFSYRVSFIPTNFYGTIPAIERVIVVNTPYLTLGSSVEFKPKTESRIKYIAGFSLSDDHLFNPQRFNDFGGYFRQENIPLYSSIFSTFIGIKL
jgi:hypothetical protein